MLKKVILTTLILLVSVFAVAAQRTVVRDQTAKNRLLGRHLFALQWISWDYFGTASVTQRNGVYTIKGKQKQRGGTDFVTIDGKITEINKLDFAFTGKIVTQVSHINGGQPCVREGDFTFRITSNRKYWRLAEISNPCDEVADYVDIFFR